MEPGEILLGLPRQGLGGITVRAPGFEMWSGTLEVEMSKHYEIEASMQSSEENQR